MFERLLLTLQSLYLLQKSRKVDTFRLPRDIDARHSTGLVGRAQVHGS